MTYFHGTHAKLEVGDVLVPGTELGTSMNHGRSKHVYMTTDDFMPEIECEGCEAEECEEDHLENEAYYIAIREAYSWARVACSFIEDENTTNKNIKAFVYIVEPLAEVEPDGGYPTGDEAVRVSSARIVDIVSDSELADYKPAWGKSYL